MQVESITLQSDSLEERTLKKCQRMLKSAQKMRQISAYAY